MKIFNISRDFKEAKKEDRLQQLTIDAPARTSQGTLEIAKKADSIVQPVGASNDDLIPAVKEFNALKS
ncbi:ParA family protein [Rhizophagus irregularis DAOM 181602=DAOM 197198]|nr:ParA family protein [Rhizophagus irregularis DAOM 181602=DAOM 197198]